MLKPFISCNVSLIEMNTIELVNINRLKKYEDCLKYLMKEQIKLKKSKINLFVHSYELFSMKDN